MEVVVIPIVVGEHGRVNKNLENRKDELEIWVKIETTQTTWEGLVHGERFVVT